MSDLISIVIPTYNRKKVISRAIDSCLYQTYKNIEVVVCDDRSTDGTLEFLQAKYAYKNNIVYCVTPEGKKGPNAARNEGARKANGKYIVFLDSDDYLLENSVEVRLKKIENKKYGLVYGNIYTQTHVGGMRRLIQFDDVSSVDQKRYLVSELSLCITSSIMIKKCVLESVGYLDENLQSWQDDDLVVSVGMKYKLCHCAEPVAVIVASAGSVSKSEKNIYLGCKEIVKKHKKEIIKFSSYKRYFIWKIRVFSLWAKYKEYKETYWLKKLLYMYLYFSTDKIITPLFKHKYA